MSTDLLVDVAPSPNFSSRGGLDVVGTVIHYTADGPEWDPVRWLRMPESRASAHFVIDREGDVTRLVKLSKKAWHAGASEWIYEGEPRRDVSAYTIGIELANAGRLFKEGGKFWWEAGREMRRYRGPDPVEATLRFDTGHEVTSWWEPFSEPLLDSLERLLHKLRRIGYAAAANNLIGHEEISGPGVRGDRFKTDPGPLFPWGRFGRDGGRRTEAVLIGPPDGGPEAGLGRAPSGAP